MKAQSACVSFLIVKLLLVMVRLISVSVPSCRIPLYDDVRDEILLPVEISVGHLPSYFFVFAVSLPATVSLSLYLSVSLSVCLSTHTDDKMTSSVLTP